MKIETFAGGEDLSRGKREPSSTRRHILGMFEYNHIQTQINLLVKSEGHYSVREIIPKGEPKEQKYTGSVLKALCAQIFGERWHGYIVFEEGNPDPILIFNGGIREKVIRITS